MPEEEYTPVEIKEPNPAFARHGDRAVVISETAKYLAGIDQTGKRADLSLARTLISRTISDLQNWEDESEVEWPEESSNQRSEKPILKTKVPDREHPVSKGHSVFPKGVSDFDDFDGLRTVTFATLERLSEEDQIQATEWILRNFDKVRVIDWSDFSVDFIKYLEKSRDRQANVDQLFEHVYSRRSEYTYRIFEGAVEVDNFIDSLWSDINLSLVSKDFLNYLATQDDDDKIRTYLGMWVDQHTFPYAINDVRKLQKEEVDPKIERIGRILLGFEPDDDSVRFHTALDDIYQIVDFEHYPPNISATEHELNLVQQIINEQGSSTIVDMGCGTGRISNGLAARGVENVIGVDHSVDNVKQARLDDTTGSVQYYLGDWEHSGLKNESVSMLMSLGRNATHAERDVEFLKFMDEVSRVLEEGGVLLIDFPNPNIAGYLESKKRYLTMLQNLGIPVDPEDPEHLKSFPYIVDSPDGENMYNRWVPQIGDVAGTIRRMGYDVEIADTEPIANSKGDENIYLLAKKKKTTNKLEGETTKGKFGSIKEVLDYWIGNEQQMKSEHEKDREFVEKIEAQVKSEI